MNTLEKPIQADPLAFPPQQKAPYPTILAGLVAGLPIGRAGASIYPTSTGAKALKG